MGRIKTLGKNTFWVFLGKVGSKFVAFLMLPFYTSWFSVEEYGITDLIQTYTLLITNMLTLSIFEAIFVFPKNVDEQEKIEYYTSGFFFHVLSFICFFVISIIISPHLGDVIYRYRYGIVIYCALITIQSYFQQFCRCQNKMEIYGISGIVVSSFVLIFSLYLIPNYKIWGYIYSLIFATAIGCLYVFIYAKQYKYIDVHKFDWQKLKEMLLYSIPIIPNGLIWWFLQSYNRPMLEHFCGLTSVGLFAVANKIPVFLVFATEIFVNAWNVSVLDENNSLDFEHYYNRIIRTMIVLSTMVAILVCMLTPVFIKILAGEKYLDAIEISYILTVSSLAGAYAGFVSSIFIINKKSQYFLYSGIWGCTICVILYYTLIPSCGAIGAAFAVLISNLIIFYTRIYYAKKLIRIKFVTTSIICLTTCILFALTMVLIKSAALLTFGGLFVLVLISITNKKILLNILYKLYENSKRKFCKL